MALELDRLMKKIQHMDITLRAGEKGLNHLVSWVHMIETLEASTFLEGGEISIITADFRKYPCIEASIADHSAYLLSAKNGDKLRYEGIAELTDYKAVAQCIKDGGYATSSTYVEKLCRVIEKWDLTRFNFA